MESKKIWLGMLVTIMAFGTLVGCASGWKVTDPFAVGQNANTGKLRLVTTATLLGLKINGVEVLSNLPEIILPAGKNELEITVLLTGGGGRGVISMVKKHMVLGKAELNIESGKTYALVVAEATGSAVASIFLGSFVPVGVYRLIFQEYASKVKLVKLAEFPAVKLEPTVWDTYQYPMIQSP
jgi:hypothetical protein